MLVLAILGGMAKATPLANYAGLRHQIPTPEETVRLVAKMVDARDSGKRPKAYRRFRNEIISLHLRFALSVVLRHARHAHGMGRDDLLGYAIFGLVRACEKFDPTRELLFSTYATWWIRGIVGREIANCGRMIRVPAHAGDEHRKARAATARFETRNGRAPTTRELSRASGLSEERLRRMAKEAMSLLPVASLDEELRTEEPGNLYDLIPDRTAPTPEDEFQKTEAVSRVHSLLSVLDPREATVIRARFGLNDKGEERTLIDIGRDFNVTRERVRQIEAGALDRLRRAARTTQRKEMR